MRLLLVLAAACSLAVMGQNVAVYPGALATCADLPVAGNLASTILTQSINSGDTTINVTSTAAFPQIVGPCASIIVVDQGKALAEVIRYCGLTPTTFTVCADGKGGRGFDGTSAMAHSTAAPVNGYVVADHVNQLAAEVIAVQTKVGTNPTVFPALTPQLGYLRVGPNITPNAVQFSPLPIVLYADYIFPTQSPSGALTAATPATITLAPVPLGVNGSDTNHRLRIPTCSGGAQVVLITGGSAVSGAASGTINFTPTNSCTAGWTIASATGGLQEAVNSATNARLAITGAVNTFAPVTITTAMTVECAARAGTGLILNTAAQDGIVINTASPVRISNCAIAAGVVKTAGAGILITGAANFGTLLENINIDSQFNSIDNETGSGLVIRDGHFTSPVVNNLINRNTINADSGDNSITSNVFDGGVACTGANILWNSGGGLRVTNNKFLHCAYGIDASLSVGAVTSILIISNNSVEAQSVRGIRVRLQGTGTFIDTLISINHFNVGVTAIEIGAGITNATVQSNVIVVFNGAGVLAAGDRQSIIGNVIIGNGAGTTGIDTTAATNTQVYGNLFNGSFVNLYVGSAGTGIVDLFSQFALAGIPTVGNGSQLYCANCNIANPCTSGGTGAFLKRINGVSVCN